MILKPIEHISRDDIYRLLESAAPETRTLEYKREIPGASDGDKVKFLKAVSGMANTDGGDVIYGIEAKDGIPTAITGFPQNQVDQTKLRLEGLLATCVEPRIPSVVLHTVTIDETNCVLIARIRRSWLAPHRITVNNHVHFYGRNSASTFQMDVSQLRNAFLVSDQHADQVRAFVVNRLLRIEQQRTCCQWPAFQGTQHTKFWSRSLSEHSFR
jgi:predicted HTH transcriptional regulator